jgi:Zn-dependent protease
LTPSARDLLETGQRLAAQTGIARVEPQQLLAAIVALPRNPAHQALSELGVNLKQLEAAVLPGGGPTTPSPATVPIGSATRYLLNNAHREAEQLGHYRVDALHLLLALLYKDSSTSAALEQAGLSLYAMRQYLTVPSATGKAVRRRPLPSLRGALGVSPVFAIPVGAMILGGAGLFVGVAPGLTLLLSLLFVVGGWVTSLCIHEFGHAFIAYLGGDRSVAAAGYLSLNPLRYTHPLLSIALPIVFLLIGGIGLPGGAIYLDERAIRSDWWRTFASAGGPLGNLLFAVALGWPFLVFRDGSPAGDPHFWAGLAFLVFLQITALLLNLLPIPPFDGFGMIAPWLSIELRILAQRVGMFPLLVLFFLLWQGGPVAAVFWNTAFGLSSLLNIPQYLVIIGQHQFLP